MHDSKQHFNVDEDMTDSNNSNDNTKTPSVVRLSLRFYPDKDEELINWLNNQQNKTRSLAKLIDRAVKQYGDGDVIDAMIEHQSKEGEGHA